MSALKIFRKIGLKVARRILCASNCWPSSQARGISEKSLFCLKLSSTVLTFSWKSFHLRQSFSFILLLSRGLMIHKACMPIYLYIDILTYIHWRNVRCQRLPTEAGKEESSAMADICHHRHRRWFTCFFFKPVPFFAQRTQNVNLFWPILFFC